MKTVDAINNAQDKAKAYRNGMIKLVHVARRELGLDEPTYRAILQAQGGTESLSAMTNGQIDKVLTYLKSQGFKGRRARADRKQADNPDARKIRALWLLLYELSAVKDPSEAALAAYVKRVAKVDDLHWAHGTRKYSTAAGAKSRDRAEIVIETLKKWAMRFLPQAIDQLKAEVRGLYQKGALTEQQLEHAQAAFSRDLTPGVGFDSHNFVWDNLRIAVGRPFPLHSAATDDVQVHRPRFPHGTPQA